MIQLDAIDRTILLELQRDSRQTYAEVGATVGLSAGTVHNRVRNLEKRGVVQSYGAQVNASLLGLKVTAFISIRLDGGVNCRDIAPKLLEMREIEECHAVAGDVDTLIKVRVASPEELEHLLFRIKQITGVQRTISLVTLSTQFERRPLVALAEKSEA